VRLGTRKLLDRAFSLTGILSIVLMAAAVLVILLPIIARGMGAVFFTGTVEFRRMQLEKFEVGDRAEVEAEMSQAAAARAPVYAAIADFEKSFTNRLKYRQELAEFKEHLRNLLGPFPGQPRPVMPRDQYGCTRWDRVEHTLQLVRCREEYVESDDGRGFMTRTLVPRRKDFAGTSLVKAFDLLEDDRLVEQMLRPSFTFYPRFFTQHSRDAHIFGGIWPELLGTLCLTLWAMIFAVPMGVVSAIYLVEYAGESRLISLLRTCVSTLAGVPSIVFGLFGLAFLINFKPTAPGWIPWLGGTQIGPISDGKSVLAGSLTLAILILPTVIRASEEAILAVPHTYREAALSLGAGKWRTIVTVILPAALPGILTGTVISMGRAAGETAPIIFTAAVSAGDGIKPTFKFWQTLLSDTPALPWNIYNICTEHEKVDEIRHVQFGMVMTLVLLVLILNAAAIFIRARIARKLRG
jgi:phosphate transport system permease protein